MTKVQCPFCKGKGFTEQTQPSKRREYSDLERNKALEMRRQGYSYREIGKALEIKGSCAQKVKTLIDVYCRRLVREGTYLESESKEATQYYKKLK